MKFVISDLRILIREEINSLVESRRTNSQRAFLLRETLTLPKGAAVSIFDSGDVYRIVMWSPKRLKSSLEGIKKGDTEELRSALFDASTEDDSFIHGVIGLNRLSKSAAWSNSERGWEVVNVAAKKGYGPLLYNFAIHDLGAVISDRNTMTDASTRVWKKFKSGASPGVTLKPLDDEDNPKTKTKKDDGPVLKKKSAKDEIYNEKMPLNLRNMAATGDGISSRQLQANGNVQIKKICSQYAVDQDWLLDQIDGAASEFFDMYFTMGQPD